MNELTPISFQDEANFLRDGYVVVRGVFGDDVAQKYCNLTWQYLNEDPENLSSAFLKHPQLEQVIETGPIAGLITPRLTAAVDQLVGKGRWWTRQGCGWVTVRVPAGSDTPWIAPDSGWHVDGIHFHHYLDSPEQALVGIEMLTPARRNGGATVVRRGSHISVARALHRAGEKGLSYPQMRDLAESLDSHEAIEVVGEAGDVLLMHPHLVHARSMNCSSAHRLAANRCFALHAPKSIHTPAAGSFSLMEQAIRDAIGLS
jgi:Phytanoyl-CoA dioxygenase (PhyH)